MKSLRKKAPGLFWLVVCVVILAAAAACVSLFRYRYQIAKLENQPEQVVKAHLGYDESTEVSIRNFDYEDYKIYLVTTEEEEHSILILRCFPAIGRYRIFKSGQNCGDYPLSYGLNTGLEEGYSLRISEEMFEVFDEAGACVCRSTQ